jgi:hypothetical protein
MRKTNQLVDRQIFNKNNFLTPPQKANLKTLGIPLKGILTEKDALKVLKANNHTSNPPRINRENKKRSIAGSKLAGKEPWYNRKDRREKGLFGPLSPEERKTRNLAPLSEAS